MAIEIGSIIEGRYKLLSQLGSGGFATVFEAEQLRTGQTVALKVLHDDLHTARAERVRARFSREMSVVAQLHHPHVVPLIDTGELENGEAYTVFKFVDGPTLALQLQRTGALAPELAKRLMGQVLEALSCAHERGIIHRDLKPENVMIATTGARQNAMVCDFGIASLVQPDGDDSQRLTAEGDIAGTPGYMAPEQIHGRDVTPRTDLYAWGLMCYEVVTGKPAVEGETAMSILLRQSNNEPIDLSRVQDAALRRIIARAIAKDPEERYPSADALLDDFEVWTPEPSSLRDVSMDSTIDGDLESILTPVGAPSPVAQTADGPIDETFDGPAGAVLLEPPQGDPPAPGDSDTEPSPALPPTPPPRPGPHPAIWALGGLAIGIIIMLIALSGGEDDASEPQEGLSDSETASTTTTTTPAHTTLDASAQTTMAAATTLPDATSEPADVESPPEVACGSGMVSEPPGSPCCWQGQRWSSEHGACVGEATCPEFYNPTPSGCELYNKSAWEISQRCEEGDPDACYTLSSSYALGQNNIAVDFKRANALLDRACTLGYNRACFDLANIYLDHPLSRHFDLEAGTRLLEPFCLKQKNSSACNRLGSVWREKDPERTLRYHHTGCLLDDTFSCRGVVTLLTERPDLSTTTINLFDTHKRNCLNNKQIDSCDAYGKALLKANRTVEGLEFLEEACMSKRYGPSCMELAPRAELLGNLKRALTLWDRACLHTNRAPIACTRAGQLYASTFPDHTPNMRLALKRLRFSCKRFEDPEGCKDARRIEAHFGLTPESDSEDVPEDAPPIPGFPSGADLFKTRE